MHISLARWQTWFTKSTCRAAGAARSARVSSRFEGRNRWTRSTPGPVASPLACSRRNDRSPRSADGSSRLRLRSVRHWSISAATPATAAWRSKFRWRHPSIRPQPFRHRRKLVVVVSTGYGWHHDQDPHWGVSHQSADVGALPSGIRTALAARRVRRRLKAPPSTGYTPPHGQMTSSIHPVK